MDMKEKMPLTPTTPVPTTSAAIEADANRKGPATVKDETTGEAEAAAPTIDVSQLDNLKDSSDAAIDTGREPKMCADKVGVFYGDKQALKDVSIKIYDDLVTAFIGPSGCGKSTFLRCLNRMNDTIPSARVVGRIDLDGEDITSSAMDVVQLRARVGMVFQKPNPFPKSIYDNIAYGPRVIGMKVDDMDAHVEESLRSAALWDEVKDKLKQSAYGLSGGQQQRLCIARTIATRPDVILMDEPCSALDPIATSRIEDLMTELRSTYTIIIVTHNMQQAARVSDRTAFFTAKPDETTGNRTGLLVEYDLTKQIFSKPADERTEAYISGRFG